MYCTLDIARLKILTHLNELQSTHLCAVLVCNLVCAILCTLKKCAKHNMICSSTVYVLLVCENQHTLCRFNTQPKPKLHTFFGVGRAVKQLAGCLVKQAKVTRRGQSNETSTTVGMIMKFNKMT